MIGRRLCFAILLALTWTTAPVAADEYRLGTLDRLRIKVQEWPDLTGEYTVTADGVVSLPLIGNVNAAGLRVGDVAQEISDRLQRRSEGEARPFAAVEILQFRPFSIVGDVQRPGEYPYRPGLTVLQAVGIAGGYYRPEVGLLRLNRDMAVAEGEIRTLMLKQNRLAAREARLTAALSGSGEISFPPDLTDQKDNPAISAILESERGALRVERETVRSERASADEIKELYEREIGSLRGQIEALKQEDGTIQQQLKEMRSLSARGLALMPTLFNLERSAAQIANERLSAETAIVRADQNIALSEQRLRERDLERNRLNTRELQQTKDEFAENRARIRTASDLLTEAQVTAPAEARERFVEGNRRSGFTVMRKEGGVVREIAADEMTLVLPDDIIKIPMVRPKQYINMSRSEGSDQVDR
jgi:polysaccharide biosynthesis/export protein ExoF